MLLLTSEVNEVSGGEMSSLQLRRHHELIGGVCGCGEQVTTEKQVAHTAHVSDELVPFLAAGVCQCWTEVLRWHPRQWNNK